jgi:hypothetical protein
MKIFSKHKVNLLIWLVAILSGLFIWGGVQSQANGSPFVTLMLNSAPSDPIETYDIAAAAGAIKAITEPQKQRAMQIISEAFNSYQDQNRGAIPRSNAFYTYLERYLFQEGLLTDSFAKYDKSQIAQTPPPVPVINQPARISQPVVQPNQPVKVQTFEDVLSGASNDKYRVYNLLLDNKMLSLKAIKDPKSFADAADVILAPYRAKGIMKINDEIIKELKGSLKDQGFLN